MTEDPDGNVSFGNTGRVGRPGHVAADRARISALARLDRLTLRVTRRPRLLAIAAGLAVVVLLAGGIAIHDAARPATRPATAQPRQ